MKLLGVDTGGTFTDFVLYENGRVRIHKVLSTPHAPEAAILQGIADLGLDARELRLVHGSTVATNAVLEGKGVRTLYIGNRGLEDLLAIGRQARRDLYDLQPPVPAPPVPPDRCLATGGRLAADGTVVEPLTETDLAGLRRAVEALRPEAVAINLLYSYLDDRFERAIEAVLPEGVFVARSSAVLPVAGEYERGIATWLNAWVGPLVSGYLRRLIEALPGARVAVMQSSGEAIAADLAGRQAVRLLLSGPAGGLTGARFVAGRSGESRLLTFDMGGTSTDVALIEGAPRLTSAGRIGPWPVAVPMVDMHTIGAGGGSIARLDEGGMLQVGPESAGAAPGPVCYGQGGMEPTVTDANLVLGRLLPDAFLGGRMHLDRTAAHAALAVLGQAMGCSAEEAAAGVIRVANAHMARALRVISVQRGIDPRGHTLVSFGGAGGLHVCALADALGMRRALVPAHAGVLSALGMLVTQPGRQLFRTWLRRLDVLSDAEVTRRLDALADEGRQSLREEGIADGAMEAGYSLDVRYCGQSATLNVPWEGVAACRQGFRERHRQRYGHSLDLPLEVVNLRVALQARGEPVTWETEPPAPGDRQDTTTQAWGIGRPVPVTARVGLLPGARLHGPALITETVATTWLAPGWSCEADRAGNLLLTRT